MILNILIVERGLCTEAVYVKWYMKYVIDGWLTTIIKDYSKTYGEKFQKHIYFIYIWDIDKITNSDPFPVNLKTRMIPLIWMKWGSGGGVDKAFLPLWIEMFKPSMIWRNFSERTLTCCNLYKE